MNIPARPRPGQLLSSRAALAGVAFLLLTALRCPDFSVDSQDGTRNLPASDHSASVTRTLAIPSPIGCAQEVAFHSDETEAVGACAGYNFATLYGRADTLASNQAGLITCPRPNPNPALGCPFPWTWRSFHAWKCGGSPPRATASVQWKANCLAPGVAGFLAPTSITAPTPAELLQGNPGAGNPAIADQIMSETIIPAPIGCNPPEVVRFEYNEEVTPRPGNLQSYVQEAERLASIYHASLSCAAGCTKKPYVAVHRQWSWANNLVTVVIRFVPCR